ncbi:MAG: GNAT family N-acetyltransferase [Anaerolineales bacterium]|nr:GNAT family N-acetyltransferase [Anaerolineales bacterium]
MPLIRAFDLERDYAAVLAVWRAAEPGVHVGRSDSPEALRLKLTRDPHLFLVAEDAGRLVGVVLGGFDGRRGLVYHLAVDPAARGQGLGSALMDELERRLRALGCVKGYLLVVPENQAVLDWYARRGWNVMNVHVLGKDLDQA